VRKTGDEESSQGEIVKEGGDHQDRFVHERGGIARPGQGGLTREMGNHVKRLKIKGELLSG